MHPSGISNRLDGGTPRVPVTSGILRDGLGRTSSDSRCQDQPMALLCHFAGSSAENAAGARAGVLCTAAKASSERLWFGMWTWRQELEQNVALKYLCSCHRCNLSREALKCHF